MGEADARVVLLAGASGLTGARALDALLEAPDFTRVLAISRRPLGREHPRLANRIVQFPQMEAQLRGVTAESALCCLGTTLRRAGSKERFREVDVDCVLTFARTARAAGVKRFVVISAAGADAGAKNFYLRTKGEMEQELEALGFESLDILQPSLLLGWRKEMRPLELVACAFMPLVNPLLGGKYAAFRGISAITVGKAMLGATRSGRRGVQRYTYAGIEALSRTGAARARTPPPAKAAARAR
jgi:uncharacterized protein YbjT (DUF2867 family)